jgi:glycine/D-amino acid oxidase-like deaminating enzyme
MVNESSITPLTMTPYWWEAAKPEPQKETVLPASCDVVIVGAGYTGLSAALTLGKAGLDVVALDSEMPGFGASSRNGGMIGNLLKPGLEGLFSQFGEERGTAIYQEALNSVSFIQERITEEDIDCDLSIKGRFYPAILKKHYSAMARDFELRQKYLNIDEEMVGSAEYGEDVDSSLYVGGLRQLHTGGLHPAKYLKGLLSAAKKAGVKVIAPMRAEELKRRNGGFTVVTGSGMIKCQHVLIATNGYSSGLFSYIRNRIIPVGSTIIATEELSENFVKSLFPTGRMITDTRKMLSYYRPSPDGKRVLLGGRPSVFPAAPEVQAKALQRRLTEIFPQLAKTALSHVWSGKVGYSFSTLPAVGQQGGIFFAMGYCGSGVAMSGYLGHKAALKILEDPAGETAFDNLPFEDRFYYKGNPWFLPPAMIGYKIRDKFGF